MREDEKGNIQCDYHSKLLEGSNRSLIVLHQFHIELDLRE